MSQARRLFNLFAKNHSSFLKTSVMSTSLYSVYMFQKYKHSSLSLDAEFRKLSLSGFETLQEGEMREYKWGTQEKQSILILKYDGKLRALSNYCPHFGAPMHTGVLIDRIVKCPWHGASFDVLTGKADISPSINDLETYEIIEENDQLYVKLPSNHKIMGKVPEMAKCDPKNRTNYVILGGGAAGLSAAETLRQAGYTGQITIVSSESTLPYDRTIISKFLPPNVDKLHLRGKAFFEEYGIKVILSTEAKSIDKSTNKILLSNGETLEYEKVLIATGSTPVLPSILGIEKFRNSVHLLRTFNDANAINTACKSAKNVVILGGSFISLEIASFIKKANKEANVTVVIRGKSAFEKELGTEVGKILMSLHEQNGVKFELESEINELAGNKTLQSALLKNGKTLDCDMVVIGAGTKPNTEIVSQLVTMDDQHIKTNVFLNTSDSNIYCAGDVCSIPFIHTGIRNKFGHWVSAQQQGAISALNMLEKNVAYDYVPYYWTRMWDKTLQYTGNASSFDEVFVEGDASKFEFVAYYFKNNKIVGFAAMNKANAVNIMYEAFKANILPRANLIKNGTVNIDTIKASLAGVRNKCSRSNCACFPKI